MKHYLKTSLDSHPTKKILILYNLTIVRTYTNKKSTEILLLRYNVWWILIQKGIIYDEENYTIWSTIFQN